MVISDCSQRTIAACIRFSCFQFSRLIQLVFSVSRQSLSWTGLCILFHYGICVAISENFIVGIVRAVFS